MAILQKNTRNASVYAVKVRRQDRGTFTQGGISSEEEHSEEAPPGQAEE
jgi:hypothetical protein